MNQRRAVKPVTYLKNRTADLVREVNAGGGSVTIIQNGEAKVVVMDVGTYDRWRDAMTLLKMLAQAEALIGPTVSALGARTCRGRSPRESQLPHGASRQLVQNRCDLCQVASDDRPARGRQHEDAQLESSEVLLVLQILVGRNQGVEGRFGSSQQVAVGQSATSPSRTQS